MGVYENIFFRAGASAQRQLAQVNILFHVGNVSKHDSYGGHISMQGM